MWKHWIGALHGGLSPASYEPCGAFSVRRHMAKSNPRKANGSRRRKIRARWRAIGAPCALCGRAIDYGLGMVVDPWTGKRRPHPMSFVVDEIVPVSKGGDPLDFTNTQPAHWICNARRGDRTLAQDAKSYARANTKTLPLPQPWDL